MPVIDAEDLSKWYGDVIALNDISFSVPSGITGLLGPNGAGKTTLLHLVTGQLRPSKGSLTVLGKAPWKNQPLRDRIGFVPETQALWGGLSGREHVELAARLHEGSPVDQVGTRLDAVGLDAEDADRRVREYSRGMRQRLKLAMGLVHEPDLLLLDEPFAGLDPVGRREMMDLLKRLPNTGTDVVFSSHVLHEVETLTRTILVLVNGLVVAEGDVHEIRSLMDRHPHQVRLIVDQPRRLAQTLIAREDVERVRVDGGHREVIAETTDPQRFYADVQSHLLEEGYEVKALTSPDDNLQAVFEYLTQEEGTA